SSFEQPAAVSKGVQPATSPAPAASARAFDPARSRSAGGACQIQARPRVHHAARVSRVVAIRGAAYGAGGRTSYSGWRGELGSPFKQAAQPRHATSGTGVE